MDRLHNQEFERGLPPKLKQQLLEISLLSNWLRKTSETSGSHPSNPGKRELVLSENFRFNGDHPETLDITRKTYTIKTTHPPVITVNTKQHTDMEDFINSNQFTSTPDSSSQPLKYTQTKYQINKDGVEVTTTNLIEDTQHSSEVSFDDPEFTQTVSNLHSLVRIMTISEFNYANRNRPSSEQVNSLMQVATEIAFKQQHLFLDKPVSNTYQFESPEPGKIVIESEQRIPDPSTISIRSIQLVIGSSSQSPHPDMQTVMDQFYSPNLQVEGEIIQFNLPKIPTLSSSWGTIETRIPNTIGNNPTKSELTTDFLSTRPDLIKSLLDNIFYLNPPKKSPQASLN